MYVLRATILPTGEQLFKTSYIVVCCIVCCISVRFPVLIVISIENIALHCHFVLGTSLLRVAYYWKYIFAAVFYELASL